MTAIRVRDLTKVYGELRAVDGVDLEVAEGEFVGVLGRLLTRGGNRVGALLYGDRVHAAIPARSGRRQGWNCRSVAAWRWTATAD